MSDEYVQAQLLDLGRAPYVLYGPVKYTDPASPCGLFRYVNTSYAQSPLGWAMLGGNNGVMYWQADDTWPGPSWSSIEIKGRLKVSHYAMQRAYAPRMVAGRIINGTLVVHFSRSDYSQLATVGTLRLTAFKWSGGVAGASSEHTVALPGPHSSARLLSTSVESVLAATGCGGSGAESECVLLLEVLIGKTATTDGHSAPAVLAKNWVYLTPFNEVTTMSDPGLVVQLVQYVAPPPLADPSTTATTGLGGGGTFNITVTAARVPAALVWLETTLPGRWSDNGLLLTTEVLVLQWFAYDPSATAAQLKASLSVWSLFDVARGYSSTSATEPEARAHQHDQA